MEENKRICPICGRELDPYDELVRIDHNGEELLVCEDCAHDEGYAQCDRCGRWEHMDNMVSVNANVRWADQLTVCEDCATDYYYHCDDCGGYFDERYVRTDDWDHCVCDHCYEQRDYITCEDCGRITNDYRYNEEEVSYYCLDCAEQHERRSGLHDYSYKPSPDFQYLADERKTARESGMLVTDLVHSLGVELEVDEGENARNLVGALGALDLPIYMKHDGSLSFEGVEIVTHPCSLAYHMESMPWNKISNVCRMLGYRSHDTTTCGLHIHIGRQAMGTDTKTRDTAAANLVILADALWDNGLVTFTRRKVGRLNQWAARPDLPTSVYDRSIRGPRVLDLDTDEGLRESALLTRSNGRYQAVNLTNRNTVEFRIFRGTLKRDTIIAALQLCWNMTEYAMHHTPLECRSASWADIMAVRSFAELSAYCADRGIA